jgi:hypothetical protein
LLLPNETIKKQFRSINKRASTGGKLALQEAKTFTKTITAIGLKSVERKPNEAVELEMERKEFRLGGCQEEGKSFTGEKRTRQAGKKHKNNHHNKQMSGRSGEGSGKRNLTKANNAREK